MKIGDEVYVHGYVDEIRNDVVIIRNDGGYFGTVEREIFAYEEDERGYGTMNEADRKTEPQTEDKLHDYCKKRNCVWWSRSLRICFAERNELACKYKSGKE